MHTLICPSCGAGNRVPEDRIGQSPQCGRCKTPLFPGKAFELSGEALARHRQHDSLPLVVDFWAPWCGPCRMMAPHFNAVAERLEPNLRFAKLDTEAEQAVAADYGIRSIPTLMVFHHGQILARESGAMDTPGLMRWLSGLEFGG